MKAIRDDVRQRILDAAQDDFLEHGYDGASMRAIAAQAKMTVGNIYLYFAGKAQLFEAIVTPPVQQLQAMLRMQDATDESIRQLAASLHDVFIEHRVAFLILITRSQGSKYATFKEMIIMYARRRMEEIFTGEDAALTLPLSVAIIDGLLAIFDGFDGDEARLQADLLRFLNYMLRGFPPRQREVLCEG